MGGPFTGGLAVVNPKYTRPISTWFVGCALLIAASAGLSSRAAPTSLQVGGKERLIVAVYTDFAPFSDGDEGIDVDVGKALAEKLGRKVQIMSFKDGETVDDDLRNVLWKGYFLWNQPLADVMMHVPVDKDLARKNDKVTILAAYFNERLVVARNRNRIPQLITLDALGHEKIAVQFDTIEDHYLMTSFGGRLQNNVVHFATIRDAVAALRRNEVAAVIGSQVQIESALAEAAQSFGIAPVATPGLTVVGWDIGVAVNATNPELAALVENAMVEIGKDGTIERIFTKRGLTYAPPRGAGK